MAQRVLEEIFESNEWRQRDFAAFKANQSGVEDSLWCRICLPMVYAHWEGYVVSSLKILLDYLDRLNLSASQVPTNLIVIGLNDVYKSFSGKQSFVQRVEFTDKFSLLIGGAIRFPSKVNAKSNLNPEVLMELCEMYGFDFKKFETVSSDLKRLVHIRNQIAHGERGFVLNRENLLKFVSVVEDSIQIFYEQIEDFISNEKYKVEK